jgi:hypothetical protein
LQQCSKQHFQQRTTTRMQNVALPTKEATIVQQNKGPKGVVLVMRFNNDGKYCLRISIN